MKHAMSLYANAFNQIKDGHKTREYRLNDTKRRTISVGDIIEFFKSPNQSESVVVIVKGLRLYQDWYSCYKEFFDEDFKNRYSTIEEVLEDTYDNWWSREDEKKYGCVIIEIEKI